MVGSATTWHMCFEIRGSWKDCRAKVKPPEGQTIVDFGLVDMEAKYVFSFFRTIIWRLVTDRELSNKRLAGEKQAERRVKDTGARTGAQRRATGRRTIVSLAIDNFSSMLA